MSLLRLLLSVVIFVVMPVTSWAEPFDEPITHEPLRKALESFKMNRHFEALKVLSEYHTDITDTTSLAQFHFIYAQVMRATKKPLYAIEHLRLAYLYSPKGGIKERALLERAETYLMLKYFYEAKSDYQVFLKSFPESHSLGKARIGLAKSLMGLGLLKDAIEHYEKAGNISEAMFGKANAMQRLGKVKEANEVYSAAISHYSGSLQSSDETLYYFGENLRLVGRLSEARRYLSSVKDAGFKDRAEISLGLIAVEESKTDMAMKHFRSALLSQNRQVKRSALFYLAEAETKAGKTNEAKAHLEEIRCKHPYNKEYDEATFILSKLYRKEGKFNEAVSLLKELILKNSPKKEALDEFEGIIVDVKEKDTTLFLNLWKSFGKKFFDKSREQFLLKVAEALKNTGKPFLELSLWLSKNGSDESKAKSLSILAEFYADMGDIHTARKYLRNIKTIKHSGDEILRAEAKILFMQKDFRSVSEKLLSIKNIELVDLKLLGSVLTLAKDVKKAVAFYEKTMKDAGGNADDCIRLADILYVLGKKTDSLHYYRLALSKDPGNEWALYKSAELSDGNEGEEMLRKAKKGNSVLSNFTNIRLKELAITRKMEEIL